MSATKTRPTDTQVLDSTQVSFAEMCEKTRATKMWEGRCAVWMDNDYIINEMLFVRCEKGNRREGEDVKFYFDGHLYEEFENHERNYEDIQSMLLSFCINQIIITDDDGNCEEFYCN